AKETVEEKGREGNDHEVVVLSEEQYFKIQEELARLARQQEEMLWLMQLREKKDELREKKDEEFRQLLTSVLRNQ
ncbi:hypothetical protein A2U01_0102714, partial [Trifolium medium]|nr:hypothetical protein [Trifolium medium]